MKKTTCIISTILYFFFCIVHPLFAQTENADALPKRFDLLEQESVYWMPNLLQSSFSGINEMAQYQGFAVNWVPRGLTQIKGNTINGIDWQSNLSGWDPSFSFAGLYGGMKTEGAIQAYGMSAFGLGGQAGNQFSSSNASLFTKSKSISSRVSNGTTMQELRMQWHSGRLKNATWINIDAIYQGTPSGFLANGLKDRKGILVSIEKSISEMQQLGIRFWWSPTVQGKRAPTVGEMFAITNDLLYNPSWGWRNGQAFYANTKKNNAPVMSLHYAIQTSKGHGLQFNLGGVFGTQSTTQLDWSNAADPRPDYYKYLPSFAMEPALKNRLLQWYARHPELVQIQFDQLIEKNQSNSNEGSKYIINERIQQLQLLRAAMRFNYVLNATSFWYTGMAISFDRIGYTNQVADLLGGQFYYNYNTWVNDEGLATAFQNDIQSPDRKIKLGESWGAHYYLYNKSIQAWTAITGATRFLEWGAGLQMGVDQMQRKGLNQNGLYPSLSKGLSEAAVFPSFQYQFYLRYKFNGRLYLTNRIFREWASPDAAALYTDPANHSLQNPFLLPLTKSGTEIKLQFMGSNIKASIACFIQTNRNERQYKLFYHDYYNAFVRASAGQIQTLHQGLETFIETNWSSPIQINIANSYGWYSITNQPIYEIRLSDNLYKVQSGQLLLKKFPATAYPQAVQAVTMNYQPVYSLRLSYTLVYASRRAISHDLFRRSTWTKENILNLNDWEALIKPVFAPNQWVSNVFVSKSFQLQSANNKIAIRCTASIRNVFNAPIPSLVFEQSRYDYKKFKADKFPAKYIYDLGRTYTVGLQLNLL